jgi:putative tryptophan/tyrosine transport system substrate-binding protein
LSLLGGAAITWPLAARAQQPPKTRRIAFVHSGLPVAELTETSRTTWNAKFFAELRRLGLVEGANLAVERYSAEGSFDRYGAVAAQAIAAKPEVLVANSPALVKALGGTVPIVAIMGDPIASGLVTSLARPAAT